MPAPEKFHVTWMLSNCSTAPYFNWFARNSADNANIKFSFINLHAERPDMIEDVGQFGCECVWVPFDFDKRKRNMLAAVPKIVKALNKLKPDIVHTHLFDDSLPGLIAAKIAGIKVRMITKGDTGFHHFYFPQWKRFDRLNNRNATNIIAISEQCKDFIIDCERGDRKKISLIHHGIPLEETTLQNEELKKKWVNEFQLEGKTVIGTVARFIKWKGHHLIIEAAKTVVESYPNVIFLFVGNGDEKANMDKQIAKLGLSMHFRFIEWVNPEDIPSVYGLMDIYLHAASYEPFGFVIAEALANGVPVVSTHTGSARDSIVNGVNGYLVDEGDVEALAKAITLALGVNRSELSGNARNSAKELFDFETMWQKHINLYQQSLS